MTGLVPLGPAPPCHALELGKDLFICQGNWQCDSPRYPFEGARPESNGCFTPAVLLVWMNS